MYLKETHFTQIAAFSSSFVISTTFLQLPLEQLVLGEEWWIVTTVHLKANYTKFEVNFYSTFY